MGAADDAMRLRMCCCHLQRELLRGQHATTYADCPCSLKAALASLALLQHYVATQGFFDPCQRQLQSAAFNHTLK